MTRSDLLEILTDRFPQLTAEDAEHTARLLVDAMSGALAKGQRIEIRGFGSFVLRRRSPRMGRNPRTGELVPIEAKLTAHFKPGKALREAVDAHGKLSAALESM